MVVKTETGEKPESSLEISKVTQVHELQGVSNIWNNMLKSSNSDSIFLTHEWVTSWVSNFLKDDKLYILFASIEDELVGIAPFYIRQEKIFAGSSLKTLRFIGDRDAGSEYLDLIIKKGFEKSTIQVFFEHIFKHCTDIDLFSLSGIHENSPNLDFLKSYYVSVGWQVLTSSQVCSQVHLPNNWQTYLESFKGKHRYRLKSTIKKLMTNFEVKFYEADLTNNLEKHLISLFLLHQKKWVSLGLPGSFHDINKRNFYREMAGLFNSTKYVKLYCLEIDNEIKACQFSFLYNNQILSLQEGFDPDWRTKRIGNVLRALVIEKIINEGVEIYDFLGGISDHKRLWGAVENYTLNLTCYKNTNLKSLAYIIKTKHLKGLKKKLLPKFIYDHISARKERKQYNRVLKQSDKYLKLNPPFRN